MSIELAGGVESGKSEFVPFFQQALWPAWTGHQEESAAAHSSLPFKAVVRRTNVTQFESSLQCFFVNDKTSSF